MIDLFGDIRADGFDSFWSSIPPGAKSGKHTAERAFSKLRPAVRDAALRHAASYYAWWRAQNPQASWLHPSTYLNQRRWEDEAYAPPASAKPAVDRAAFWAEAITAGKFVSPSCVSPALCDEMLGRKLVTREQLRERGLA